MTETVSAAILKAAEEAYEAFEQRTRDDGETFTALKDDHPSWVFDMVYSSHGRGAFLPDDYRYSWTQDACEAIVNAGEDADLTEVGDEFADDVDIYTNDRLTWLASNLNRPSYCDEAREEGLADDTDIITLIGMGQYMERREVFGLVLSAIEARAEEIEDDEETSDDA